MSKEDVINILTENLGMVDYIDVTKYISDLEIENKQLQDNWNKLKEYVDTSLSTNTIHLYTLNAYRNIQNKMQELERDGSDE